MNSPDGWRMMRMMRMMMKVCRALCLIKFLLHTLFALTSLSVCYVCSQNLVSGSLVQQTKSFLVGLPRLSLGASSCFQCRRTSRMFNVSAAPERFSHQNLSLFVTKFIRSASLIWMNCSEKSISSFPNMKLRLLFTVKGFGQLFIFQLLDYEHLSTQSCFFNAH